MDVDSIRTRIEEELEWRKEEIAFFVAQLNNFKQFDASDEAKQEVENDKKRFRRALVLILYAHFEGFFRYSFAQYVEALNEERIALSKSIDILIASSLYKEFGVYDNMKWSITQENIETSKAIKNLENRVKWIQKFDELRQTEVVKLPISERHNDKDSIIYTESNLTFDVIQKILYRLGFPPDNSKNILNVEIGGKKFKDVLNEFLGRRNAIAHGDNRYIEGVTERDYERFETLFKQITEEIPRVITVILLDKLYLKEEFR